MSIDAKLLADIIAQPLDDGPRLVAADALQERGDPRGMFIVAQCRLLERGVPRDERKQLERDTAALLKTHKKDWAGKAESFKFEMRRGFVDSLEVGADALAAVARDLFAKEPITKLTLNGLNGTNVVTLDDAGAFTHVTRLRIHGALKGKAASGLGAALAKRKAPLDWLNVCATGIDAAGVAHLLPGLEGLRSLALTSNSIGDEGARHLASAKELKALEALYLTATDITEDGVKALAASKTLKALKRLSLARNEEVTEESLKGLVRAMKSLRWLEYSDEDEGQQRVGRSN